MNSIELNKEVTIIFESEKSEEMKVKSVYVFIIVTNLFLKI